MDEQVGWRALLNQFKKEAPRYAQLLPELPRLWHDALKRQATAAERDLLRAQLDELRRMNRLLAALLSIGFGVALGVAALYAFQRLA